MKTLDLKYINNIFKKNNCSVMGYYNKMRA